MLAINATETVREGSIFGQITTMDHEQLVICQDKATGLKALIGIHNTVLGPALGGTRMWPYGTEEEAIKDVLRLSRGMTFKNSLAGLNLGGGKAVILGDPKLKTEAFLRRFGRFVESLGGRYVTAEDVNRVANTYFKIENARIVVVGKGSDVLENLEKVTYEGKKVPVKYFDPYANEVEKPIFSKLVITS